MTRRPALLAAAALFATPITVWSQSDAQPGTFGFAIDVDGDGFFMNPTLKSVTIKSVVAGRPAAVAGIKQGDQVLEVNGRPIAGAKARDLEPHLRKNVGESLNLRLRRQSGEIYSATLVAVPRTN